MSSHVEEASVGRPQASDWARSHKRKPRAGPGRPPKRNAYGVAKMAHELKGTGLCRRFLIAIGYEIARDSQALAAFHQALADGLAAPEAMELAHEGMRIAKETASLSADVTAEEAPLSADVTAEEAEAARRAEEFDREGVICNDSWERLELRCVLSFQRLTDPARGAKCKHLACCNYQVLRDYVGRVTSGPKECPIAACGCRLQRTRDVERNSSLQAALAQLPQTVTAVWVRGDEVRTTDPLREGEAQASHARRHTRQHAGRRREYVHVLE